ncbi:3-ketosteroid dehydrogenase [Rhodoplanes elegans]|uniref:3-ketosteroid dehydrogenase n=1 Tax=Rhodoplanes elegans TaxID=29408 RepID=A0A327KWS0_9BRAD|nr:FAD-dependent oxidoreductase [Rhodoplanes elegans]MBK5960428.1 3-ketosteroid dehydrogenase [Rhodoplanes elegans]RAI42103.1 3-ketosteroid dehydrogenase [Rhodoplanes elegans]
MTVVPAAGRHFEVSMPVVVIGAGAAGLVAALAARAADVDVLVLERDPVPRGSTAMSAGLIPAPATRWQAAAGIVDTAELFAADILAKAHREPDACVVTHLAETIGPTLEWLADAHGLPFDVITEFLYPGHSTYRMHGLPTRSGVELIERLSAAAEETGVMIMTDARVDTLYADPDGRVRGIGVVRPDDSRDEVGCGALVLACSGYGGNPALVARHIPELADALFFGHEGNQGDALVWGEALGAATRHLSGHQGHGAIAHPHGIQITWATITQGGVQVNRDGRRFADETLGYSEQAAAVVAQPDGIAFTIFDERIAAVARGFEDFRQAEAAGAVVTAASIPELAERLGLPVATLTATLCAVEAAQCAKATDAFGRDFSRTPPLVPPYRAVKVTGALLHTQGGLVVGTDARVLRDDGTALPNLFAVGGAACGVSGSQASGYLSGNGLLSAVGLGRTAGLVAACAVKAKPVPRGDDAHAG